MYEVKAAYDNKIKLTVKFNNENPKCQILYLTHYLYWIIQVMISLAAIQTDLMPFMSVKTIEG